MFSTSLETFANPTTFVDTRQMMELRSRKESEAIYKKQKQDRLEIMTSRRKLKHDQSAIRNVNAPDILVTIPEVPVVPADITFTETLFNNAARTPPPPPTPIPELVPDPIPIPVPCPGPCTYMQSQQFAQDAAQAPYVRLFPVGLLCEDLWAHVVRGATRGHGVAPGTDGA